jgi:hypothetical protein
MRAYFHLPYRQTEGVVRVYTGSEVRSIPDYSTIWNDAKEADRNAAAENNDVKRVIADGAYNNNENSDIFLIMALKPQSR